MEYDQYICCLHGQFNIVTLGKESVNGECEIIFLIKIFWEIQRSVEINLADSKVSDPIYFWKNIFEYVSPSISIFVRSRKVLYQILIEKLHLSFSVQWNVFQELPWQVQMFQNTQWWSSISLAEFSLSLTRFGRNGWSPWDNPSVTKNLTYKWNPYNVPSEIL